MRMFDDAEEIEWSPGELAKLIRNVFKNGENEWTEITEDMEFHPSRTPNQVALKWRQVKLIMS